ncbi:MAG TPA: PQQ-binding-like beta-propeller repeat protein [Pyrinomonadaceae bacterium]|jgi:outer membrane protein assembly factor BamB|nr:PQQ-binding-like beta-propeller repeat protein [Pyrinomonadaceae bacterium]
MTSTQIGEAAPQKLLRVWPGVVAVVLQWVFRFGVKELFPGIQGFGYAVLGSLAFFLVIIAWWMFFSRARWRERFAALGLLVGAVIATWFLKHESMWLQWLLAYSVPVLSLAFVTWAVATRRLSNQVRHATMVATILIACGAWLLLRQDGINGDHNATFGWRWSPSAEERLLAQEATAPATSTATPEAVPAATPATAQPTPTPATAEAAKATAPATPPTEARVDWPGFRGPRRDGVVRGTKIKTDWTASPPVQLWRHPVGPGWSSFAVNGDLVYTQEQRGDKEVVACYKASTGQPVWTHSDSARFFESNAGAGPRGTPTLSNGRVYAFGATGILNALDARDGAVVWTRNVATETNTKTPFWGFSSSPLVIGDVVIVAATGQLVAYETATGNKRWVGPAAGGSYSSPQLVTINGVAQVLLTSDGRLTSVSPADGKQLWQHDWAANSIVQPAVMADGNVLITSQGAGIRRLAVANNGGAWSVAERWTSNGLKPYFNDFVVHKGYAFGFDGRILSCVDLSNGERKWKGGRYGNGQLVLLPDQDLLLVLSEEGELALVQARSDQFTEIAKVPAIQGKTWNHPVLVGDVLLVRNAEEMAAFRLSRTE